MSQVIIQISSNQQEFERLKNWKTLNHSPQLEDPVRGNTTFSETFIQLLVVRPWAFQRQKKCKESACSWTWTMYSVYTYISIYIHIYICIIYVYSIHVIQYDFHLCTYVYIFPSDVLYLKHFRSRIGSNSFLLFQIGRFPLLGGSCQLVSG